MILDILLAVVEASYASVPLTGKAGGKNSKREILPGWSREVEQFRLNSNAAYRSWLAAGKPRQGHFHQFRHAVGRVKRAAQLHQAQGLFEAAMAGDLALMRQMKRIGLSDIRLQCIKLS